MKIEIQLIKLNIFIVCTLLLCTTLGTASAEFNVLLAIDHSSYQFSIELVDFSNNMPENDFLLDSSSSHKVASLPGILSSYLGEDGYPMNQEGVSMASLFSDAIPVNRFFPENADGTWLFDSTQCFASLQGDGFVLYQELGTIEEGSSTTLDHGQFLPFNDLTPDAFSIRHPQNLYDALNNELPDDDPRKGERLYSVGQANHYFGLEMDVAFTYHTKGSADGNGEARSGNAAVQDEDLIAYFTADDDLWVYIDGMLVLDLGGVHSAIPGSINFSAGTVTYRDRDGKDETAKLYKIFQQRYREQHPEAKEREVQEYIDGLFRENSHWQMELIDGSEHTMKIIYLERGAGASNLCIGFNLDVMKK